MRVDPSTGNAYMGLDKIPRCMGPKTAKPKAKHLGRTRHPSRILRRFREMNLKANNMIIPKAFLKNPWLHGKARRLFFKSRKNKKYIQAMVSSTRRVCFVRIPKVASTSIRSALLNRPERDFEEVKVPINELNRAYREYYKVAFARSPWSRVVSLYNEKICGREAAEYLFYQYYGLHYKMDFDDFIEFLLSQEGRDDIADAHWISQNRLLTDDNGDSVVDYIGRFESLTDDWRTVCAELSLDAELPHSMGHETKSELSLGKHKGPDYYLSFYNEDLAMKVGLRYQEDVRQFSYKIPDKSFW